MGDWGGVGTQNSFDEEIGLIGERIVADGVVKRAGDSGGIAGEAVEGTVMYAGMVWFVRGICEVYVMCMLP